MEPLCQKPPPPASRHSAAVGGKPNAGAGGLPAGRRSGVSRLTGKPVDRVTGCERADSQREKPAFALPSGNPAGSIRSSGQPVFRFPDTARLPDARRNPPRQGAAPQGVPPKKERARQDVAPPEVCFHVSFFCALCGLKFSMYPAGGFQCLSMSRFLADVADLARGFSPRTRGRGPTAAVMAVLPCLVVVRPTAGKARPVLRSTAPAVPEERPSHPLSAGRAVPAVPAAG